MTREQIEQLIADYHKCEFGLTELIKRTESVVLENVCEVLNHYCNRTGVHPSRRVDMIDHIRKEMEV